MNEDFTLWLIVTLLQFCGELASMGINLPYNKHLKPLLDYQAKLFDRPVLMIVLLRLKEILKSNEITIIINHGNI